MSCYYACEHLEKESRVYYIIKNCQVFDHLLYVVMVAPDASLVIVRVVPSGSATVVMVVIDFGAETDDEDTFFELRPALLDGATVFLAGVLFFALRQEVFITTGACKGLKSSGISNR